MQDDLLELVLSPCINDASWSYIPTLFAVLKWSVCIYNVFVVWALTTVLNNQYIQSIIFNLAKWYTTCIRFYPFCTKSY